MRETKHHVLNPPLRQDPRPFASKILMKFSTQYELSHQSKEKIAPPSVPRNGHTNGKGSTIFHSLGSAQKLYDALTVLYSFGHYVAFVLTYVDRHSAFLVEKHVAPLPLLYGSVDGLTVWMTRKVVLKTMFYISLVCVLLECLTEVVGDMYIHCMRVPPRVSQSSLVKG